VALSGEGGGSIKTLSHMWRRSPLWRPTLPSPRSTATTTSTSIKNMTVLEGLMNILISFFLFFFVLFIYFYIFLFYFHFVPQITDPFRSIAYSHGSLKKKRHRLRKVLRCMYQRQYQVSR
jgi:hypothetical protein